MFCFWKRITNRFKSKKQQTEIEKDVISLILAKIELLKLKEHILAKMIEKHLQGEISEKELKKHIENYIKNAYALSNEICEKMGEEYTELFRQYIKENTGFEYEIEMK